MSYTARNVDLHTRIDSLSRLAWEKQSYRNIRYLLVSFLLGILYFFFFALGLTISFASVLILSIPTLIFVIAASRYLADFERTMVITWLHVDIRPMSPPLHEGLTWWERLWEHMSNPVTWKSLVFLLAKCPLGILSIVIMGTLCVLTAILYAVSVIVALVGILGLFNTLAMSVLERRREIGILRSMGATGWSVARVFWIEGLTLSMIAWGVAAIASIPAAYAFVSLISAVLTPIPFSFAPATLFTMLLLIVAIATLASVGPAVSAARARVNDILRYE